MLIFPIKRKPTFSMGSVMKEQAKMQAMLKRRYGEISFKKFGKLSLISFWIKCNQTKVQPMFMEINAYSIGIIPYG